MYTLRTLNDAHVKWELSSINSKDEQLVAYSRQRKQHHRSPNWAGLGYDIWTSELGTINRIRQQKSNFTGKPIQRRVVLLNWILVQEHHLTLSIGYFSFHITRCYHTWHLFTGFIRSPLWQWNAFWKSREFCNDQVTLKQKQFLKAFGMRCSRKERAYRNLPGLRTPFKIWLRHSVIRSLWHNVWRV